MTLPLITKNLIHFLIPKRPRQVNGPAGILTIIFVEEESRSKPAFTVVSRKFLLTIPQRFQVIGAPGRAYKE